MMPFRVVAPATGSLTKDWFNFYSLNTRQQSNETPMMPIKTNVGAELIRRFAAQKPDISILKIYDIRT